MTRINIVDIATGKLITWQEPGFSSWDVIADAVACWFDAHRSQVKSVDDEDGNEFITVDGSPVAKVEWVNDTKQRFAEMHDETMTMLAAE